MDQRKQELKSLKKACKQAKRRTVTPWKIIAIFCLVIALIFTPLSLIGKLFDNTIAAMFGFTFWDVTAKDPDAIYYAMDFGSQEEMDAYSDEICYQTAAEGTVLLMNNGALPLSQGDKVSTLSTSSVRLVYGGTGNADASEADDLKTALEKSGLEVNQTLWDFYLTGEGANYPHDALTIAEAPWSIYPEEVKNSIAACGDAVIITLCRMGSESADPEFTYLQLDEAEKEMMAAAAAMKAEGRIQKIIVLINASNALQVDFLKNNQYSVDACLWIGGAGARGTNALADILVGNVNPSGSLVDTYCYDNFSSPAMKNAVPVVYGGYDGANIPAHADTYLVYQEGIYVGYKYYETRYEDYVMGTGNAGDYTYSQDVAFPFGYGLSYTVFSYSDMCVNYNASSDQFEVTVTVTNTGSMAGKETVQVYSQSPYTDYDRQNSVEKASVNLVGFGKTQLLDPGQSENVTVYVDKRDLASYDAYGAGTYILDAGDYYLTVASDAHNAVNNTLAAKGYTVGNTDGRMDADGNASLSYKWVQEQFDAVTYSTSANGTPITNQLSLADPSLYGGTEGQAVTWLTRSDWAGTFPSDQGIALQLTDILIADLQDVQYDPADYAAVQMPTLGADNSLSAYDMIGLDYDDPLWDTLLDQLTFDEMTALICNSFRCTDLGSIASAAFPSGDVMAATCNTGLIYEVGKVIGNNCLAADVACLYSPGAGAHRTPYSGNNFAYCSEDGFLSGAVCAAKVRGIQDKGVNVVIKHFALGGSQQDRIGLGIWLNEQAAREVYLKTCRAAFEEGDTSGVMTACTRLGATWSGAVKGLMNNILRQEWSSNGMSLTDSVLTAFVTGADGILAGTTAFDTTLWHISSQLRRYENDALVVNAMRDACHHNLYALVNSSTMNGIGPDTAITARELPLVSACRSIAIVSWVLFAAAAVMWILGKRKWKNSEAYLSYKTMQNTIKAEKKAK